MKRSELKQLIKEEIKKVLITEGIFNFFKKNPPKTEEESEEDKISAGMKGVNALKLMYDKFKNIIDNNEDYSNEYKALKLREIDEMVYYQLTDMDRDEITKIKELNIDNEFSEILSNNNMLKNFSWLRGRALSEIYEGFRHILKP